MAAASAGQVVQGYLRKKRHKFNKWNQRWFVLRANTLFWYAAKTDTTEAGKALIEAGSTVVNLPLETECDFQFSLSTPTFSRLFKTQTQYELDMWYNALRKVINAENDKNPAKVLRPKKKNVLQKLFTRRKNSLTLKGTNSPAKRGEQHGGAVFGIDLADLEGPGTPKYLHEWYDYLLRYGLKIRGLFRKPGENNLVKKLRDMYDREETFDLATEVGGTGESSVHCVASLMKLFFRETKVPLFPEAQNEIITESSKQSDEANVIYLLGRAVSLFPKSRQNIIKDLFLFLQKVSQHVDTNLMSPNNLAVCLTPSLFQTNSFQTLEDLQALKPLTAMTAKYIQFADKISFAGRRVSTSNRISAPAMAKPRVQSMPIASSSEHFARRGVPKARAKSDTSDGKASRQNVSGAKNRPEKRYPRQESTKEHVPTSSSVNKSTRKPHIQRPKSAVIARSRTPARTSRARCNSNAVTSSEKQKSPSKRPDKMTEKKLAAAGWETKTTGDGRVFYFHRKEQRSSWSADGLVNCWIRVVNKGKTYYYHSHTHERRWNKPDGINDHSKTESSL